ncbi:MAG: hypothetical protein ACOZNI_02680 [Myxococcota bacterium]
MSLTFLCASAFAARVWWASPPDDASSGAVARVVPDAKSAPLDDLVTGGRPAPDARAIQALRDELAAVRPLIDEFDGELQIMARLQKAANDVHRLDSPADRNLLHEALVFQGYAVQRYFQDKLGVEAAAAPYRAGEGPAALVLPWLDAAALAGAPAPSEAMLPDAPARIAFDNVQAASRAMPSATILVGDVAKGAEVRVDGLLVPGGPGSRVQVVPGRHVFDVRVGETFLLWADARLPAGTDALLTAPFGPAELAELRALIGAGGDGWSVPEAALAVAGAEGEAVYVAVPAGEKTILWRVDSGTAARVKIPAAKDERAEGGLSVLVGAGGGWISTGDFLLLNGADGAPESRETVNAGSVGLHLAAEYGMGALALGAGVDAQGALGEWHALPTGDATTRAFVYPHAAVGVRWAQLTVGPMFPWYVGVGGRGRVPVWNGVELFAAGVYGAGLVLDRGDDPEYRAEPVYNAWGGVDVRFGG